MRSLSEVPRMRGDWMSVDELACKLNVTRDYASKLLRTHKLRPIRIVRRKRYVWRASAERYRKRRGERARHALRELARISQEAGFYRA